MFSKILNKCFENINKNFEMHFWKRSLFLKLQAKNTCEGVNFATLLKIKFLHRYVSQTLMTFPDTFCGFLQISGTRLFLNTSKWPLLEAVVLYLLTDILLWEKVLSKVILEFTWSYINYCRSCSLFGNSLSYRNKSVD